MEIITWIVVGILIVIAFIFLRVKHFKHKVIAVVLILLLMFLYVSFTRVVKDEEINLKSAGGIEKAVKLYFVWLGSAFNNLRGLTGHAVKMDWSFKNETKT